MALDDLLIHCLAHSMASNSQRSSQPPGTLIVTSLILKLTFEKIYISAVYKLWALLILGYRAPSPSFLCL